MASRQDMQKAVAHVMLHPELLPESALKFKDDLYGYQETGKRIEEALKHANKTIEQLSAQMDQLYGSVEAVVKIIARELGEEKIAKYSKDFIPAELNDEEPKQDQIEETKCAEQ